VTCHWSFYISGPAVEQAFGLPALDHGHSSIDRTRPAATGSGTEERIIPVGGIPVRGSVPNNRQVKE